MTDLATLLAGARLEGIDVVRCLWERDHPTLRGPLSYPAQLTQHIQLAVRQPEPMPQGGAAFLIVMQVRWADENDRNVAAGEVHVRVTYAFADETAVLSQEEGKEFGHKVAQHQAWPYLRHRLQQLCMELGINPVVLPLKPLDLAAPPPDGNAQR